MDRRGGVVRAPQSRPKPRGRSRSRASRSTWQTSSRSAAVRESTKGSGSWSRQFLYSACRVRSSARAAVPVPRGSNGAGRTCCPPSTSTSSSPCPRRSPRSPLRTRPSSTVSSSAPSPRRCARSPPILADLGAEIGFFAVLHTWGQTLVHHPHLHCVIPGGGFATDGTNWVSCRPGFFLPVRILSRYFRRVLLAALQDAFESGKLRFAGGLQALDDPRRFADHLPPGPRDRMGGLCEATLRRPRAGPRLPRPLHPPHRHQRPAPVQPRRQLRALPLQGLSPGRHVPSEDHDADGDRVPPAHAPPRAPARLPPHSLLQLLANCTRRQKLAECRRSLHAPPLPPAEHAGPATTHYRDRYEALTGRSLWRCPRCDDGNMLVVECVSPAILDSS